MQWHLILRALRLSNVHTFESLKARNITWMGTDLLSAEGLLHKKTPQGDCCIESRACLQAGVSERHTSVTAVDLHASIPIIRSQLIEHACGRCACGRACSN